MRSTTFVLACLAAATMHTTTRALDGPTGAAVTPPIVVASARVSLDGTSTMHPYTASTTTVRVNTIEIGGTPSGDVLEYVLQPGALTAFDVSIPVTSLTSPKDGIDKNMYKALKADEYADIRFRLHGIEAAGDGYRATGSLTIAGVERDVTLTLQVQHKENTLAVTGNTDLLMTDYGITPPKMMMGLLKTHPKVQIRIELVLGVSTT